MPISASILAISYLTRFLKLFGKAPVFAKRWGELDNHLMKVLRALKAITGSSGATPRRKLIVCVLKSVMFAILQATSDLYGSILLEITWLIFGLAWGTTRLILVRQLTTGISEENDWSFGQLLPVLLLVLPFFAVVETFIDEMPQRKAQSNHSKSPDESDVACQAKSPAHNYVIENIELPLPATPTRAMRQLEEGRDDNNHQQQRLSTDGQTLHSRDTHTNTSQVTPSINQQDPEDPVQELSDDHDFLVLVQHSASATSRVSDRQNGVELVLSWHAHNDKPSKLHSASYSSSPSQSFRTSESTAAPYTDMADKKSTAPASSLLAAQAQKTPEEIAREHDLLPKLIPHFDRHLIFPLLEFVASQEAEPIEEITKTKYELLKHTNMTDYVANLWREIHGVEQIPEEFLKKREEVLNRLQLFVEEASKITELLENDSVVTSLRSDKLANLQFLKEQHGVTIEMVNSLYDFGRFQYSCGSYQSASELLFQFRLLSTDNDKVAAATWGKLASEILTTNWDAAMEEVQKVKESIDSKLFNNPLAQLQHRTWLIHWALFPFFNYDPARDTICELFFSPTYINTIQTNCPWILRYLAAAVITNRNRGRNTSQYHKQLKDLVRIVKQENYEYNDPVTDFVKALYIDFDFEEAQKKLGEAEEVLRSDFFLVAASDAFVDSARHLISESYCKIHQRIDIKDLSTRLGLSQDEGEKWIVNLIRDTRVDAKIDYKEGTVVMNHPPQSVYQQVIERTKGGFFRTQVLSAAVAKS
ncbi:MAG: eukaryotic translation initiation factor 3 subunit E [Geoglossum umbratile]|nr:MAG: eukaryotic translation initiation factor 3 subunit E [Geoglossum umbratile]